MFGWTPAHQSELTAWSQEAYPLPTSDRTRESRVYVRQQKPAEGQQRFDSTEKPSSPASEDNGRSLPRCPRQGGNGAGDATRTERPSRRSDGPPFSESATTRPGLVLGTSV